MFASMRLFLASLLFLQFLLPLCALAQDTRLPAMQGLRGIKGLRASQVMRRFGEPDARRGDARVSGTWKYGSSILIFSKGRVTSWSDAGELASRQNLALIKETGLSDYEVFSATWENAWTPKRQLTANDILDDLLEQ